MSYTQPTYGVTNITDLAPEPTLQSPDSQIIFDKTGADAKAYIIQLISELEAVTGADSLGVNALGVVASNVADAIAEVQANVADASSGTIVNGSITDLKMDPAGLIAKTNFITVADFVDLAQVEINKLATEANAEAIDIISEIRVSTDTTGTSTAYILDTESSFDFALDGNVVRINPHLTNTASSTIEVDSTTKAIKKFDIDTDAYVSLEAEDIKKNNPTELRYDVSEGFFVLAPKSGGSPISLIQQGSFSILNTSDKTTVVLGTSVNVAKTAILLSNNSSGTQPQLNCPNVLSFDGTNLVIDRQDGGSSMAGYYQVIEYDNIKSFQHGVHTFTGTSSGVTISSVDLTKSVVSKNYQHTYTTTDAKSTRMAVGLTNDTTLVFNAGNSATYKVDWYVVEFN